MALTRCSIGEYMDAVDEIRTIHASITDAYKKKDVAYMVVSVGGCLLAKAIIHCMDPLDEFYVDRETLDKLQAYQ